MLGTNEVVFTQVETDPVAKTIVPRAAQKGKANWHRLVSKAIEALKK